MQKSTAIKFIKQYLKVLDENNFKYEDVYFFGSRARGDSHKYSDIDVCLVSTEYVAEKKDHLEEHAKSLSERINIGDSCIEPHLIEKQQFGKWHPLGAYVLKDGIKIIGTTKTNEQIDIDKSNRNDLIDSLLESSKLNYEFSKSIYDFRKDHTCLIYINISIREVLRALIVTELNILPPCTKDLSKYIVMFNKSKFTREEKDIITNLSRFNIDKSRDFFIENKLKKVATREYTTSLYPKTVLLYKRIQKRIKKLR